MRFYVYISLLPSEIKDMLIHTMTALLLMYYYYKVFAHQKFIVVFSAQHLSYMSQTGHNVVRHWKCF